MKGKTPGGARKRFSLRHYDHPDEFGNWLGYRITRIDRKNSAVEVRLKIRRDHLSPAGRAHGGVISALLDFSCGAAVFSTLGPRELTSTVELKVNYLQPLELGDELKARVSVVFRGKRLAVVHGYLHRGSERSPAAMVTGTFNIVPDSAATGRLQKKTT